MRKEQTLEEGRWRERPLTNTRFPYYFPFSQSANKAPNPHITNDHINLNSYFEKLSDEVSTAKKTWHDLFQGTADLPDPDSSDVEASLKRKVLERLTDEKKENKNVLRRSLVDKLQKLATGPATQATISGLDDDKLATASFALWKAKRVNVYNLLNPGPPAAKFLNPNHSEPENLARYLYANYPPAQAIALLYKQYKVSDEDTLDKLGVAAKADLRLALVWLVRYFWYELSYVSDSYQEDEPADGKLHYLVLYASPDPQYDGRTTRVGYHAEKPRVKTTARRIPLTMLMRRKADGFPQAVSGTMEVVKSSPDIDLRRLQCLMAVQQKVSVKLVSFKAQPKELEEWAAKQLTPQGDKVKLKGPESTVRNNQSTRIFGSVFAIESRIVRSEN